MSESTVIGSIKHSNGKIYQIKWNRASKEVYVSYAGWSYVGKAGSATDAHDRAECWLAGKK